MQVRDVDFGQLGALAAIAGGAATGAYGMYKSWRVDRLQGQESNIKYALLLIKSLREEIDRLKADIEAYRHQATDARQEAEVCRKEIADLRRLVGGDWRKA